MLTIVELLVALAACSTSRVGAGPATSTSEAVPGSTTNDLPCRASDLKIEPGLLQGSMGNVVQFIGLTNTSDHRCTIDGTPTIAAVDTTGSTVRIDQLPFPIDATATGLRSGEFGEIGLSCCKCARGVNNQPQTWPALRIRLPGGDTFDIHTGLDTACGIGVSSVVVATTTSPSH